MTTKQDLIYYLREAAIFTQAAAAYAEALSCNPDESRAYYEFLTQMLADQAAHLRVWLAVQEGAPV